LAYASEIVIPATQIEDGKGSVVILYTRTDQKLLLRTSSRDQIVIGGNSYFSTVNNDLEGSGARETVAAKLMVNPHGGLYYWLSAGSGSYEMEIPSVTVKNRYATQDNGFTAGAGLRKILFPDTLFTPAIAVDLGVRYDAYDVSEFQSGAGVWQRISAKLELTEIQAALTISKVLHRVEPYGGLKVFRTYTRLSDRVSFGSISGIKDNAGLFLGARLKIYPKEFIVVEGNLIGETSFSAGWNVEF
jgi:hypothetical protein